MGPELLCPGYLYSFSTMQCPPFAADVLGSWTRAIVESYRTMNELLDELVEQAANLMGANAFDAMGWTSSVLPFALISTHAFSLSSGTSLLGVLVLAVTSRI